jgi:uncharacterized protein (DUF58 family)
VFGLEDHDESKEAKEERIEILRRIRAIELVTRREAQEQLAGNYRSHFRGQGMQFSEFREYVPGDDIRRISWTVSARTKSPVVKQYEEERELNVILVLDKSGSQIFSSGLFSKGQVLADACTLVAFSAMRSQDRVGAYIFTEDTETWLPPRRGHQHGMKVIELLEFYRPKSTKTNIKKALEKVFLSTKSRSVIVLASDFLSPIDYESEISKCAQKHEVLCIRVTDPRERDLPNAGLIEVEDPETGRRALLNTARSSVRKKWSEWQKRQDEKLEDLFQKRGIELLDLSTDSDPIDATVSYFARRKQKK